MSMTNTAQKEPSLFDGGKWQIHAVRGRGKKKRKTVNPDSIGGRIYELRKSAKMSQKQFAKQTYTTDGMVCRWENGDNLPSCEMIVVICNKFNVSADWLLGLEEKRV